jgi:hypothetical protein
MIDYFGYVETVIARGDYILANIEQRIDKLWIEGKLTDSERETLLQSAADGAKDVLQIDVAAKISDLESRVYALEHPAAVYPEYVTGQVSERGQVYRADVTGDGVLDLVRYDGGRASTSLGIGKIDGWHLLDDALNVVATITRDADKNYIITPVNSEPEEPTEEPTEPTGEPTEPTE